MAATTTTMAAALVTVAVAGATVTVATAVAAAITMAIAVAAITMATAAVPAISDHVLAEEAAAEHGDAVLGLPLNETQVLDRLQLCRQRIVSGRQVEETLADRVGGDEADQSSIDRELVGHARLESQKSLDRMSIPNRPARSAAFPSPVLLRSSL